jgi:hypothetical protein
LLQLVRAEMLSGLDYSGKEKIVQLLILDLIWINQWKNNPKNKELVELYIKKLKNNEIISISRDTDVSEHTMAHDEARTQLNKICVNTVDTNTQK